MELYELVLKWKVQIIEYTKAVIYILQPCRIVWTGIKMENPDTALFLSSKEGAR